MAWLGAHGQGSRTAWQRGPCLVIGVPRGPPVASVVGLACEGEHGVRACEGQGLVHALRVLPGSDFRGHKVSSLVKMMAQVWLARPVRLP
jgi:hypothetical protein